MLLYSTGGVNKDIIDIYKSNFEEINSIISENIHLIITEQQILTNSRIPGNNSVFTEKSFTGRTMTKLGEQFQHHSSRLLFVSSVIIISIIQERLIPVLKRISKLPGISIEEKVKQSIDEFMNICEYKDDVIDVISNPVIYKYYPLYEFTRSLDEGLILQCIKIEGVEGLGNPKNFILYRGSKDAIEGAVYVHTSRSGDKKEYREGYSISYNQSLLNGYFVDKTACTYNFMLGNRTEDKYKHYYKMRKFNYDDNSNVSQLFFIPPLHPYLQLSSTGEMWHARSKIYRGSPIRGLNEFAGTFDDINSSFLVGYSDKFPDYLSSNFNKKEIEKVFTHFIQSSRRQIIPFAQNVVRNNTVRTSKAIRDEYHPEGDLFGGYIE
jgi:hypothetical protein